MNDKLGLLLERIKELERELVDEIHKKESAFGYEVKQRKVHFLEVVAEKHRRMAKTWSRYLRESRIFSLFTAPVIWSCLIPILLLDLVVSFYQFFCFPVYGIPKVRRADYVIMDRHKLGYLNWFERMNCVYCEYVNGVIAYAQEIAGRTEQYWCPIKHAMRLKTMHSRYQKFFDYGDAEQYRQRLEEVRQSFEDLKKEDAR